MADRGQSADAARLGLRMQRRDVKNEGSAPSTPAIADETNCTDLPIALHKADRQIAELILQSFLDTRLAGKGHCLTTGQVLQKLAPGVANHHSDLFKSLLKQMCELSKGTHPSEPSIWTLRREFWPSVTDTK